MEKKPWYMSLTLRGLALTTLAIFAPKYAAVIPDAVRDIGAAVGLVTTLIGRIRNTGHQVTFISAPKSE